MAGWASANKFSLIGALRAAAQLIAYELPMILAAVAVVMQAGTLSLVGIIEAQQQYWFVLTQPVMFVDLPHRRRWPSYPDAVRHADRRLRDHLRRLHRVHGPQVRVLPARRVRRHRGVLRRWRRSCSSAATSPCRS